jgi:hypothetical protein
MVNAATKSQLCAAARARLDAVIHPGARADE